MKTKLSLLLFAAAALCLAACTHDNPGSGDNPGGDDPISDDVPALDGSFVPFKTFVEHYTAPDGDGEVKVNAKFDSQGRTNGFTITDGDSPQIVFEVTYGSGDKFTVVEKEVPRTGAAIEHRRMEGTLVSGLLKEATVTEGDGGSYSVAAVYDKDGHVSTYTTSFSSGDKVVDSFTWADGNLMGYTSTYTRAQTGTSDSYRFAYEYGTMENRSGLAALMAYPDDFYTYPIGFLLGTAFTKNVPVKKLSYNGEDEMDWAVEYKDFTTDSNGLVTSFLRKALTEYSGDDFTYTLTY